MWNDIVKHLPEYQSAVFTGLDSSGYPFSVRCRPKLDPSNHVLRIALPHTTRIQPGPASLLCHYADDQLWNAKSFLVRGFVLLNTSGWIFHPQRFVLGASSRIWNLLNLIRSGRRTAKRYLETRGLPRPKIPWTEITASWKEH